jgi:molecular chaperone GrpE
MLKNTDSNIDPDNLNDMSEENATMGAENPVDENNEVINEQTESGNISEPVSEETEVIEKDPVDVLKSEIAELKDKYLRLYADFENFRRRTAKEKLEMISGASAEVVKAILPIVDDFERAKVSFESSKEVDALKEGVDLIYTKLYKTLESKGLKPMNSKGEVFDADLHESITQFPAPDETQKGKVIDEIEKGYFLHDKVIRYAKVIIGA